jgi:hypothetical protein
MRGLDHSDQDRPRDPSLPLPRARSFAALARVDGGVPFNPGANPYSVDARSTVTKRSKPCTQVANIVDTLVALILAAVPPITTAVYKAYELRLRTLAQNHALDLAREEQAHKITTDYLDRALDPDTPIARRHQLLRFLAAEGNDYGARLRTWAGSELKIVGAIVKPIEREVEAAREEMERAKNAGALKAAEARLLLAERKQADLMTSPRQAPVTAAAIRGGAFSMSEHRLIGLKMPNEDLQRAALQYTNLTGSDLQGSNLARAVLQGADLRTANLTDAILSHASLHEADLRGSILKRADLRHTDLTRARLERADLGGAQLEGSRMTAFFDENTVWPDGFDPDAAGAIRVDATESSKTSGPSKG